MSEAWDRAEARDLAVAARQLGRPLAGRVVAVARRCSHGQPQVLVSYPLLQATAYGVAEQNAAEHPGDAGPCCEQGPGVPPIGAPFPHSSGSHAPMCGALWRPLRAGA